MRTDMMRAQVATDRTDMATLDHSLDQPWGHSCGEPRAAFWTDSTSANADQNSESLGNALDGHEPETQDPPLAPSSWDASGQDSLGGGLPTQDVASRSGTGLNESDQDGTGLEGKSATTQADHPPQSQAPQNQPPQGQDQQDQPPQAFPPQEACPPNRPLTNLQWVQKRLEEAFVGADIQVQDPRLDDQHLHVRVCCPSFAGQSLVQRHQRVYGALDNLRQGRLHALSITAQIPQEPNR